MPLKATKRNEEEIDDNNMVLHTEKLSNSQQKFRRGKREGRGKEN